MADSPLHELCGVFLLKRNCVQFTSLLLFSRPANCGRRRYLVHEVVTFYVRHFATLGRRVWSNDLQTSDKLAKLVDWKPRQSRAIVNQVEKWGGKQET